MKKILSERVKVIIRIDDCSYLSDMDLELRLLDIFQRNNASITFGVIPMVCAGDMLDPQSNRKIPFPAQKADWLKKYADAGVLEIAQHGYSHQAAGIKKGNPSEFSGRDLESQRFMIRRGKELLEELFGRDVNIFIPPWNQYDENTLYALEALGFHCISTGMNFGDISPASSLRFLPASCDIIDVKSAVTKALSSSDPNPIVVGLFHAYDLYESGDPKARIDLQKIEEILTWLVNHERVEITTFATLSVSVVACNGERYRANRSIRILARYAPPFLSRVIPDLVYWSGTRARYFRTIFLLTISMLYSCIVTGAGFISYIVFSLPLFSMFIPSHLYAISVLSIIPVIYILVRRMHQLNYIHLSGISVFIGIIIGLSCVTMA